MRMLRFYSGPSPPLLLGKMSIIGLFVHWLICALATCKDEHPLGEIARRLSASGIPAERYGGLYVVRISLHLSDFLQFEY